MKRVVGILGASLSLFSLCAGSAFADDAPGSGARAFQQLNDDKLASPNVYRNADGAPGPQYWQQRADYQIKVKLDEAKKHITGSETIDYKNNSPSSLKYLWVQLDQNRFRTDSISVMSDTAQTVGGRRDRVGSGDSLSYAGLRRHQALRDGNHGYSITAVKDASGKPLKYTIVDTMMRIDLPVALRSGSNVKFSIDWSFNIIEEAAIGGRGGYERFDNDTYIYFLAQWFPRMAAYTDYAGWQHKAFLGRGEFTLEFGDYDVSITVPADHVMSATGVLQNPNDVLTKEQRGRLAKSRDSKTPVFIVTPEEAAENEKEGTDKTKTWRFVAENVRDFAWSSSNKYIWDAMGFDQKSASNPKVMAMSFYPNEAEPIWSRYSTHAVAHTMEVYSKYSFPYPYPVAQSVNSWQRGGMEYPMITFNGSRPTKDEKTGKVTYSRGIKYGLVGVIIHEVGHIYFPMTVNSDERQWTWMDEGVNTFLEYLAELEWEENFPAFGNNTNILDIIPSYMTSENQVPIMTQSDSILQFGPNGYTKPAAALTVLRETVMGREAFDHAFKEYAQRWMFKRPTPSDLFRSLEDASGIDLDWFWRGWFFTTDHVDVSIEGARPYKVSSLDPDKENSFKRDEKAMKQPEPLQQSRNRDAGLKMRVDRFPELNDLYNENDEFTVSNKDRNDYQSKIDGLEKWERAALEKALADDEFVYFVDFKNIGGLVTPLPVKMTYQDGSFDEMLIPAEIWRRDANAVTKVIFSSKEIVSFELDAHHQTADADFSNNHFPRKMVPSRLDLFKSSFKSRNLMADMMVELKGKDKDEPAKEGGDVPMVPAQNGN